MSRRIADHYVEIVRPGSRRPLPSAESVIAAIVERDRQEAKAEREWKANFNKWWEKKQEWSNRGHHARRMAVQGTIERFGKGCNTLTLEEWKAIKARYQNRCAYCHQRRPLTKDHLVPLSKGGFHTAINVIPACKSCNSKKGARPAMLYNPRLVPF